MCLWHFRHRQLLPSPIEFRCGEPVGERERVRPFPLPLLLGSCLNAPASPNEHWPLVIQRKQSPLSDLFFGHFLCLLPFAFPLLGAPVAGLPSEMSLDQQLQSATVKLLVADCRLFSVDLQQEFQFFRLFNLHILFNMLTAENTSSHFV